MLQETKRLLAVVYRDYLASEEEKQEILQKEKQEIINDELEKKKKYNVDVFASKENNKDNEVETKALTVKEEKLWFTRFFVFLKKIFKK